jgi:hypothetical protein
MAGEQHYDGPAIQINPSSGYAVEMRKWETTYTRFGPPGRQYVYAEYPREMFLAGHPQGRPGKIEITSTRTVQNDEERSAAELDGWRAEQDEAITAQKDRDREMARAAAESAWDDRRLTEQAQAEREAVEASTAAHVAEVPRVPAKKSRAQALAE